MIIKVMFRTPWTFWFMGWINISMKRTPRPSSSIQLTRLCFTQALFVFKLLESGTIDCLDDPLEQYEPRFQVINPFNHQKITIRWEVENGLRKLYAILDFLQCPCFHQSCRELTLSTVTAGEKLFQNTTSPDCNCMAIISNCLPYKIIQNLNCRKKKKNGNQIYLTLRTKPWIWSLTFLF